MFNNNNKDPMDLDLDQDNSAFSPKKPKRKSIKRKRDLMEIDDDDYPSNKRRKFSPVDKLRTLLIQSYQKLLNDDEKALKRFKDGTQTHDDIISYENTYGVTANVEGRQKEISALRDCNLPYILKHIFGDLNCVEEHTIDENEDKFQKILNIFIEHFDKICPEDKKADYLKGAINICKDRENFNALKIHLERLQLPEYNVLQGQTPNFQM